MVKKSLVIILSIFLFFISPKVFASSSNYDTYININYPDVVDYSEVPFYNGYSLQYYLDYMRNTTSEYYDLIIYIDFEPTNAILSYNGSNNPIPQNVLDDWYYTQNASSHRLTAILLPKIDDLNPRVSTYVDTYGDSGARLSFNNNSSNYVYVIQSFTKESTFLNDFDSCMAGNCSQFVDDNTNHDVNRHTSYYANLRLFSRYFNDYNKYYQSYSYSNNSDASTYSYSNIYYSSVDLTYVQSTQSGSSVLLKSLYYPQIGEYSTLNTKFLTYSDVLGFDNYQSTNKTSIQKIMVGNITDLSTFKIDLDYYSSDYESILGFPYSYYIFGRVNNNDNYYSYEKLDCSTSYISSIITDDSPHIYQTFFGNNNITCTQNLSNYDSFYVDLYFNPTNSYVMNSLRYKFSQGYGKIFDLSYNTYGSNYFIYETFNDLPSNFSISLSTKLDSTEVQLFTNNKFVIGDTFTTSDRTLHRGGSSRYNFGVGLGTTAMIYNLPNQYNSTTDLSLMFDYPVILSVGTNGSDYGSQFYYYDSQGTIIHDTVDNTGVVNVDDSLNINPYMNSVYEYLEGFRGKIVSFGDLVQRYYDSLPVFFQNFIYLVFVLFCINFVYLVIRRW